MKKQMVAIAMAMMMGVGGFSLVNAASEHGGHGAKKEHKTMDHGSMGKGSMDHSSEGHGSMDKGSMDHGAMDHGSMKHDMGKTFTHEAVVNGIAAEFQVMSLAAMKMKDPDGNTHHVMVKFFQEATKEQIKDAVGKVKVITPSGKEQVATLKDYSGIFAANFTVEEKGKYGMICLFKTGGKKHLVKFWYHAM